MSDIAPLVAQANQFVANPDPATQQDDMAALAQLFVPLSAEESTALAQASLGALSLDDGRDLFPELVPLLRPDQILGVAVGLANPLLQSEFIHAAASRLTMTQVLTVLAQANIDAHYQTHGGEPEPMRDADHLLAEVRQALDAGASPADPSTKDAAAVVAEKILHLGGAQPLVTVLPVFYAEHGEQLGNTGIGRTALFRVEGTDGETRFVDEQGLDYASIDDYRDNNNLPPEGVILAMPRDGNYSLDASGRHVELLVDDARRESGIEQFRRETHADLAVGGLALVGGGIVLLAGSLVAVPAALLLAGKAALVGGGAYGVVASAGSANSQLSHGSGFTFQVGLDVVNGVLSAAGAAEIGAAGRAAGVFTPTVKLGLGIGNVGAAGAGLWNFVANADNMTPAQVRERGLMLALNIVGVGLNLAAPHVLPRAAPPTAPAGESLGDRRIPPIGRLDKVLFDPDQVIAVIKAVQEGKPVPEIEVRSAATQGRDTTFIKDNEILGVVPTTKSATLQAGAYQVEVRYTADGRALIQQQGIQGCTAATTAMLIADNGGRVNVRELSHRTASNSDTAMPFDIQSAGLKPVSTTLHSIQDLADALRTNGSAIVDLQTEIGGHVVVVDSVDLARGTAQIRDPWHGWDIRITLEALTNRLRFDGRTTATQVEGGTPRP